MSTGTRKPIDGRWWWWAGDEDTVEAEGIYEHGECETRQAALDLILPEIDEGTVFCVIEAQFGEPDADACEEDPTPFAGTRSREWLIKVDGRAHAAPAADEPPLNETFLSGKPYYCDACGLGMPEYIACEDGGCRLETDEKAERRLRIAQAKAGIANA